MSGQLQHLLHCHGERCLHLDEAEEVSTWTRKSEEQRPLGSKAPAHSRDHPPLQLWEPLLIQHTSCPQNKWNRDPSL